MVKKIAILGSTGSIGRNALRVIDALNASCKGSGQRYEVVAISAYNNVELLALQTKKYKPKYAAVTDAGHYKTLCLAVDGVDVQVLSGPESLVEIAQLDDVDVLLTAVVGAAGLPAVLAAAKKGKRLAIANKEPLVIAGELLTKAVRDSGGMILPIDSEHSAVFQAMQAGSCDEVSRVILTSSGGPFRRMTAADMQNASLEAVLSHPVWSMGAKITVDSATMMNKALEVIEARWLFDMPVDKIEVLIHPESVIHSLVEFIDGSIIAQLSNPDMCLPIQYALTYPKRLGGITNRLHLEEMGRLTFEKPNFTMFRALPLGFEVARTGGTAAVVFNAANEAAVQEFLAGRIKFAIIMDLVEHCLNSHDVRRNVSLEELLEIDAWARSEVLRRAKKMALSN